MRCEEESDITPVFIIVVVFTLQLVSVFISFPRENRCEYSCVGRKLSSVFLFYDYCCAVSGYHQENCK